jgi:lipopolysaccharide/colanic/teichoic acid biosynthesis glycosyltransferase
LTRLWRLATDSSGLSGYAQVYFGYAGTLAETRVELEYDLYCDQYFGPVLDLKIVWRTFALLLKTSVCHEPSFCSESL